MLDNWLFIAFVAPFLLAIVNLIDVYFVGGVYEDEFDGAIIAGLFPLLSWSLIPLGLVSFTLPNHGTILFFLGGVAFLLSVFFYFKSLFSKNDAALIQILYNLTVPVTLFFSWILFDERLSLAQYVGIMVVFAGVSLLCLPEKKKEWHIKQVILFMLPAVIFLAFSLTFSEMAYRVSGVNFFSGYLIFVLGMAGAALGVVCFDRKDLKKRAIHIQFLAKKYFIIFFTAEILALIASMTSQRAIDLSPSASFVATIESLSPLFVMFLSVIIVFSFKSFSHSFISIKKIYTDQLSGLKIKLFATLIICYGIYLVG